MKPNLNVGMKNAPITGRLQLLGRIYRTVHIPQVSMALEVHLCEKIKKKLESLPELDNVIDIQAEPLDNSKSSDSIGT